MAAPYWTDGQVTLYLGDCRTVPNWLTCDVLVTDPPYGRGWKQGGNMPSHGRSARSVGHDGIQGDSTTGMRDAAVALWGAEAIYLLGRWPTGIGGQSSVLSTAARIQGSEHGLAARCGHPHGKPVDVMETLIAACPPGVIADPFAGSGSTLIAARNLGRQAIGVELEERYCEAAARRLSQTVMAAP